MTSVFDDLMATTTQKDPYQSGRHAFLRGEGVERCPRYPDTYDREKWLRGFDVELKKAIKSYQDRKERERRGIMPKVISSLILR